MSSSKVTRKTRKSLDPKPFSRSGLHRLACPMCSTYGYFTVAMLEDAGMPVCWRPGCGETLVPERVELALLLGLDTLAVRELFDRTEDKQDAQAWRLGRKGLELKLSAGTLNNMAVRAFDEIVAEQRAQAREPQDLGAYAVTRTDAVLRG